VSVRLSSLTEGASAIVRLESLTDIELIRPFYHSPRHLFRQKQIGRLRKSGNRAAELFFIGRSGRVGILDGEKSVREVPNEFMR